MIYMPRIRSSYALTILDDNTALLASDASEKIVSGPLLCADLASVGTAHRAADIVAALSTRYTPAEVLFAIGELERRDLIEEDRECAHSGAFWDALGATPEEDPTAADAKLRRARIQLLGFDVEVGRLAAALRDGGIGTVTEISSDALTGEATNEPPLTLIAAQDILDPRLVEINDRALRTGHPWMLCKPDGATPLIGPYFQPDETACWRCLADRHAANRGGFGVTVGGARPVPAAPASGVAAATRAAEHLIAMEVIRLVAATPARLRDRVVSFDWRNLSSVSHDVRRNPRCPACGDEGAAMSPHPQPPQLGTALKRHRNDGGHRVVPPAETYDRLRPLVSTIAGPIRSLTPVDPGAGASATGSRLPRFFTAIHPFPQMDITGGTGPGPYFGASVGKGLTEIQARASCLGEAVERLSGVFQGHEYRKTARLADLGREALHPHALMLFSEEQYRGRAARNVDAHPYAHVPDPFDPTAPVEWSPIWSLSRHTWRLLPTAQLYYGYRDAHATAACRANSNGDAAGNCLEEAVLQGLLELIERDAAAIWWYNRLAVPAVDLTTVPDRATKAYIDAFRALGRDVWVLDITTDVGVPSFVALSTTRNPLPPHTVIGLGTHLDPAIALSRAVSEMSQSLVEPGEGAQPTGVRAAGKRDEGRDILDGAILGGEAYLLPSVERSAVDFADFDDRSHDDLQDDIRWLVARLAALDLEVLVHDRTRPEFDFPVVKVVVPGLRHFWPRFAPGRLFDVPVKLGRRPSPTAEKDLNPKDLVF